MLSSDDFLSVVRLAPLVAIDLIVTDPRGAVLLGCRRNRPAQGSWFVPGGRIRKGETLDDAFRRIVRDELGDTMGGPACISARRADAVLLGVYEHFYDDNFAGAAGIGTHYVVFGYRMTAGSVTLPRQEAQHSAYRWMLPAELLADDTVHANTKAYFAG
ncbi:GDP-mannose mannosyl hydrolase [Cupriavidus pinatubonensis]|uniref:GDP-mannose mannosyl hydrolase n=1 Tax=Cupriavidus pinatubonensis TaxID=248026 RepID=UPI0036168A0E